MAKKQIGTAPSGTTDAATVGTTTRRISFSPGSSGGTRRWVRLLTIDGLGPSNGGYANFILSGTGDFGSANRGTLIVHASQRGDNNFNIEAWAFNVKDTSDPIELHSQQISTYVFEVWARVADFNQTHELHVLGSNAATFTVDNIGTTPPATPVQYSLVHMDDRYTPAQVDALLAARDVILARQIATYRQAAAPTLPVTGDLWFSTDEGNKPYRFGGSIEGDDFQGAAVLYSVTNSTHWSNVTGDGPLGTTSTLRESTNVTAFRNQRGVKLFTPAAGEGVTVEAWVRFTTATGTQLGGVIALCDASATGGYSAFLDIRKGANGTTSASFQIRKNNSTQVGTSVNLGTHPAVDTWYRLTLNVKDGICQAKAYDSSNTLLGTVTATVVDTTYTSGYCGIVAYGAIRFDSYLASTGNWQSVTPTFVPGTAVDDLNAATAQGLYEVGAEAFFRPDGIPIAEGALEVYGPSPTGRILQRLTTGNYQFTRTSDTSGSFGSAVWRPAASHPPVELYGDVHNANSYTDSGVFYTSPFAATSTTFNWPVNGLFGATLEVISGGTNLVLQRFTGNDHTRWERMRVSGTWGPWRPMSSGARMGSLDFSSNFSNATLTMLAAGASMNAGSDAIYTRDTTAGANGIAVSMGGVYTVTLDAQLTAIASTRIYVDLMVTGATGHTKAYYRFPIPSSELEMAGSVTVMLANTGTRKLGVRGYYEGSFARTFTVRLAVAYQHPLP